MAKNCRYVENFDDTAKGVPVEPEPWRSLDFWSDRREPVPAATSTTQPKEKKKPPLR